MFRQRRVLIVAVAAGLGFLAGCRTTDPCGCEPPRQGLLSRLGLRPRNGQSGGAIIGTTVSSTPITSGGVYSGPIYSGPIYPGPATGVPPEGFHGPTEGPILPGTYPPGATLPPGPGTLPPPTMVPPDGGGFAKPIPAGPAHRRIG